MRIDGLLREIMTVPKSLHGPVISRLKVMGSMDIAERKVPQDGRANVRLKQRTSTCASPPCPQLRRENGHPPAG
jgi:type II secretory ATPase GspE/PulE/Tfp pilus assembly ATPase PilB-like protein